MPTSNDSGRLYDLQAAICKSFANPWRLRIVEALGDRELPVSELVELLGISKSNVSQHLGLMREKGVVVHRRDSFRASKIMQERVLKHPKITILWDTCLTEYLGEEKLKGVKLKNLKNGTVQEAEADGVFVAIGHLPATELFAGQLELDEKGFVIRGKNGKYLTMTNLDGVFAAGDVHDHSYKQAITAAGYGCEAALEVEKWLMEKK